MIIIKMLRFSLGVTSMFGNQFVGAKYNFILNSIQFFFLYSAKQSPQGAFVFYGKKAPFFLLE